ncbi:MAG: ParB N-terminal domain-containing protein [Nitrososphaerota archaeon]
MVEFLETSLLRTSSYNPRIVHDPELMQALVESVRVMGVRQPLLVARVGGGFEVLDGGRRLAAARAVGLERLPCIVLDCDVSGLRRAVLSIHLTQDDLTPAELVNLIERMVAEEEFSSVEEVCRFFGLSKQWYYSVKKAAVRRVSGVPVSVQALVEGSQLDEGRKAELLEIVKLKKIPRSSVKMILEQLEASGDARVDEVVERVLESMPRRLDEVTVEAEGSHTYQIMRLAGGVEFLVRRSGAIVARFYIPLNDIPIVKKLWQSI